MSTLIVVLFLACVLARLPFCEWCEFEDDQDQLFEWCFKHSDARLLFVESRCHDAWRHALATRVVVDVSLQERTADAAPSLVFQLHGGVRAVFRDACFDDLTPTSTGHSNYYYELVAHQVDRALGVHRVPAIQLRQFNAKVLLAVPSLSDAVRQQILAYRDPCTMLPRQRLYVNDDTLFGLLVGLPPPQAAHISVPPLPQLLSLAFEAKPNDKPALDGLELSRLLLLLYLVGDLDRVLDDTNRIAAMRIEGHSSAVLTDLRASQWSDTHTLFKESADELQKLQELGHPALDGVVPRRCDFDTGRCEDLAIDVLRDRIAAHSERKAPLIARWIGGLLEALCQLPHDVARRAASLHTDTVRPGVFVAHMVKDVRPDMDEDAFATRWAERTAFANDAMDKRVRQVHRLAESCIERHGASNVLVPDAGDELRAQFESQVSEWVRDKHARYADPAVRAKHLADYAALRFTESAEARRLQSAMVEQAGSTGVHDCEQFAKLLNGAVLVTSNGKKMVYRTADSSVALKHSVTAAQVEYNDKTLWKLERVPEKQRRDLLYERWLLPRIAHIDGIVQLHAALDVTNCPLPHLRTAGLVNVVEFVPRRIESLFAKPDAKSACRALALAVEGADLLLDFERGDVASDSALFMCDWKLDNFGISQSGRLRLFDVDSIQLYPRSTRYLWSKYCDAEEPKDVRKFKTECMQPCGAFRNSMRDGHAPAELFCNTTTRLCDGFDSLSNVWGYCAAVLPAILGGKPYTNTVHASMPQREQLGAILRRCATRERHERLTADEVRNQLMFIWQTECR